MTTLQLIIGAYALSALLIVAIVLIALKVPYTKRWRNPLLFVLVCVTCALLFSTLNGWQLIHRGIC